jgi:hypothetical protein
VISRNICIAYLNMKKKGGVCLKCSQMMNFHPVPRHRGFNVESIRSAEIDVTGTSSSSYFGLGGLGIMRRFSN